MFNFTLQTVVVLSLGVMIFLFARALPRIPEEIDTAARTKTAGKIRQFIGKKIPLDKLDAYASSFFEKFLRRVKLVIMKLDNAVNIQIGKLKKPQAEKEEVSLKEHMELVALEKKNGEAKTDSSPPTPNLPTNLT